MNYNFKEIETGEIVTLTDQNGNKLVIMDLYGGNGDTYIKLNNSKFFVSVNDEHYFAFYNFYSSVFKLNSYGDNHSYKTLTEALGVAIIISDDEPKDVATKLVLKEDRSGIKITAKNYSQIEDNHDIVRVCSSGSRTEELYATVQNLKNEVKSVSANLNK